jgi:hypothetical protein
MAESTDLAALETRLWAILDPYRDRLERFDLYGAPYLRRPGAKAHDWFAGVSQGSGVVRFFLLPMYAHPELLEGLSPELLKRKRGASLFGLRPADEPLIDELDGLVARAWPVYLGEGGS